METRIVPEHQMLTFQGGIPQDVVVSFLKIVFAGPKTIKKAKGSPIKLAQILAKQQGFFLISDAEATRLELHKLIDRYCDAVEKQHGKSAK